MQRALQTLCVAVLTVVIGGSGFAPTGHPADAAAAMKKNNKKKNNKNNNKKKTNKNKSAQQRRAAQIRKKRQQQQRRKALAKKNQNRRKKTGNNTVNRPNRTTVAKKKAKQNKTTSGKTLTAQVLSWEETQKFIAKQKGKVVVVDFWATWCAPCVKELPNIEALQKRYPDDVVTITFNTDNAGLKVDPLSKIHPRIVAYLKKKNIDAAKHIVSKDTDEKLYQAAKFDSVPTIFVYDRQGKLAKKLDVQAAGGKDVTYKDHVNPLVEKLVKQK